MEPSPEHQLTMSSRWCCFAPSKKLLDAAAKEDFNRFVQHFNNNFYLLLANVFISTSCLASIVSAVHYSIVSHNAKLSVAVLSHVAWILLFAATCASWTNFLSSQKILLPTACCSSHSTTSESIRCIVILGASLGFALRLCARVISGDCKGIESWTCNPCFLDNGFPLDTTLCLLALPFIFTTLLKETRFDFLLTSWIVILLAFIVSSVLIGSQLHTLELLPFLLLTLFVIMDFSKGYADVFLAQQAQTADSPQLEMRGMVTNVAHDLKTPLSSFMTGIDAMGLIIDECSQNLHGGVVNIKQLISSVDSMQLCLHNIRDTNSFMLMTINRCIDYTKASKGMKLVPKLETIHLCESLQLPLNCMKNIQDKVSIALNPVPAEICSHVITDKQWLQENVLCLLSNAVKYSSGGEVTITLSCIGAISPSSSVKQNEVQASSPVHSRRSVSLSSSFRPRGVAPDDCLDSEALWEDEKFILVEIEDEGIGVPEVSRDSLFIPFKQTQKLAGGTGLGLFSLAKRMDAMHGHYGVKKRQDGKRGSVFWFAIPYRPDYIIAQTNLLQIQNAVPSFDAPSSRPHTPDVSRAWVGLAVTIPTEVERYIDSTTPKNPKTPSTLSILIAEDSPTISRMTAMILSRHGHLVEVVENGALALAAIEKRLQYTSRDNRPAFDVILMDLQMPVMDGLEAAKRIRDLEAEHSSGPRQVIFGLSADWDDEVSQAASIAGIDCLMPKPFNVNEFYRVFNQHNNTTTYSV